MIEIQKFDPLLSHINKDVMSFEIREATITDVPRLAALHVETFNQTHGVNPNGPKYELRVGQWQQMFEKKDNNWFCLVIENEENRLIGFAKGQTYSHPDQPDYQGELNKIYILKEYQKRGLGQALILKVAEEFMSRGISSMLLFGDAKNPSNGFYERLKADKLFARNGDFHGGYGWTDLHRLINSLK